MPFSATRDLWLVLKARDEGTRAMRSFARDVRMVGDSVQLANLQAARSALRNQLAMQKLSGASQQAQVATMKKIQAVDQEIGQMKVHRSAMEEQRVSAQKLNTVLGGVAATLTATGTAMVAAGFLGASAIKGLVDSAMEYQKQSNLTRTQVDKFAISLKDIEGIGLRVANTVGVSFKDIQPALFDIFSSMEVGASDAEKLLTIFSKAAVAGQTDIQSASRATIGIMNAFQLPISSVNHLMDVQFQLVKEGIGTYEEWTQRIGLVSPSAVRAGQSVEMMAAALAATTRMGISAARSGTAVARAFDAMSNPAAVNSMKALGVNALDASGKFRPIIDVLRDFRTALEKVPQSKKIATILDVFKGAGGTIEARRFLQNMLLTPGNLEMFQNIFQTMSKESGSFEQAYAIMADTAATKSELLANKWETVKVKAGEALIPTFLKIVDALGKVFDWFNKLDPRTQKIIATSAALAVALAAVGGVLLLLLGTIAAFAAAAVVAGSSLFVVMGVVTGLGVALAGLVATLATLWIKSKSFRDMISETGKKMGEFRTSYIIPTAQALKEAWDKYMGPPLQKLYDIVATKILPIFKELHDFTQSSMFGSMKELGNTVKEGLIFAFKTLGQVIKSVVIPIIEQLTKFYHDHEDTIKQLIGWMMTYGKWVLKVALILGGVLAVVLIGPVVAAFTAFIAIITAVIAIIVYLVEAAKWIIHWFGTEVPKAWEWLVKTAKNVWSSISDFFSGLWNDIVGFFTDAWNRIVNVFNTVTSFITQLWNAFWGTSIGKFLKATIDFILALLDLLFTSILFLFEVGLAYILNKWNEIWSKVKMGAEIIWNWIFPYLKGIWTGISDTAITVWNAISDFFVGWYNKIKAMVIFYWNWITSYISGVWNTIKTYAVAAWTVIYNLIADKVKSLWDTVTGIWDRVKSTFTGLTSALFNAGKNIIQGLIDGMTSKINDVTNAIKDITKKIRDHLPFSPAKIGPLSGKGSPYIAGKKIGKMVADGMASSMSVVNKASNLVASATGMSAPSLTPGVTTGRTYNQNIVIHTQEINPRRQAAELGFMLAGGM